MRRAARGAFVLLVLATAVLFLAHHRPVAEVAHTGPEAHTAAGAHAAHGKVTAHSAHGEASAADCADAGAHCWSAKHELALPAPTAVSAVVLPDVPVPAVTRPDLRREPVRPPPDPAELSVLRI